MKSHNFIEIAKIIKSSHLPPDILYTLTNKLDNFFKKEFGNNKHFEGDNIILSYNSNKFLEECGCKQ